MTIVTISQWLCKHASVYRTQESSDSLDAPAATESLQVLISQCMLSVRPNSLWCMPMRPENIRCINIKVGLWLKTGYVSQSMNNIGLLTHHLRTWKLLIYYVCSVWKSSFRKFKFSLYCIWYVLRKLSSLNVNYFGSVLRKSNHHHRIH
jgi:hypothetical protein